MSSRLGLYLYLSMPKADPQCVAGGQGDSTATSRSPHASDPTWNEIFVGADGRFNQHSCRKSCTSLARLERLTRLPTPLARRCQAA